MTRLHSSLTLMSMLSLSAVGCTGLSWGENEPGGDTWVEPPAPSVGEHRMGAIAVERDEDQLWVVHEENRDGTTQGHLSVIDPVTGTTTEVLDVTGASDRRVVFPAADRMILLAQRDAQETLVLFDTQTLTVRRQVIKPTWYWGTRTAPSGRALVVADNHDPLAPLHVIDTATLAHRELTHGGDAIEAMWNHGADILLALSVTDPFGAGAVARVHRYDLRTADLAAPLPAPAQTWEVPGLGWDYWFSYTWISISPDDRWAVFPLVDRRPGPDTARNLLLVLDQQTGTTALVPGSGPVGFTHDSASIVSYGPRVEAGGGEDLWLIDPVTHATKVVTMPFVAGIMFHPMRDAAYIVCSPVGGSGPPAVYDVANDVVRPIAITTLGLYDFVARPGQDELWLQSAGSVFSLSLPTATLGYVDLDGAIASTINVRPTEDQAVIGDSRAATVHRLAMATRLPDGGPIALPSPFVATATGGLPRRLISDAPRRIAQSPFDPAFRAAPPQRAGRMDLDDRQPVFSR